MHIRRAVAPLVALGLLVAGCLGGAAPGDGPDTKKLGGGGAGLDALYPRGVHPYPRGDEWPADLVGPFKLKSVTNVKVQAPGATLDGYIWLPDVPAETKLPVVLWSTPYFGQTMPAANDPALADNSGPGEAVPVNLLIEHGYAVALFNVRGTGNSEGCFEFFGPNEQKDQALLVEWLSNQTWSNGRVGMMGLSYHGTTPWEAAINNPPSLKTIVVAGMVSDLYTFFHTPQGAAFTIGGPFYGLVTGLVSLAPPSNALSNSGNTRGAPTIPGRVCPELLTALGTSNVGMVTDLRDEKTWRDRNLIMGFPKVTTSVFLTHGFQDNHGSGHQQQEDWAWSRLPHAPTRILEGQWGHEFPNFNSFNAGWKITDWNDRLMPWLDFWLKGIGTRPPGVGLVDYQDGAGEWHTTTSWPPVEAHEEVLYFNAGKVSAEPATAPASFRSVPNPSATDVFLCPVPGPAEALVFTTAPGAERVLVAGNPFAYLPITSDQPGGLVAVHVFKLRTSFSCGQNGPSGARLLVAGVANLRFHAGNLQGKDFPTGTPTAIRIDITNLAEWVEPGERLAFVVSYGDPGDRTGTPFVPNVALVPGAGAAPHVVLPLVQGTLGGAPPTLAYPERPFLPPIASE